jgi:hypothetical protein
MSGLQGCFLENALEQSIPPTQVLIKLTGEKQEKAREFFHFTLPAKQKRNPKLCQRGSLNFRNFAFALPAQASSRNGLQSGFAAFPFDNNFLSIYLGLTL